MADATSPVRRYLVNRGVIVLFVLLIAPLVIPFLAVELGLESGGDLLIQVSLPLLVFVSDLTGGLTSIGHITPLAVLYIVLSYIVAVVVAALGRVVYRNGREQLA